MHDGCAQLAVRATLAQRSGDLTETTPRGRSWLIRAGRRLNFSKVSTDTKRVSVPKNSASNCRKPEPVVGSKPWLTNGRARTTDLLQMLMHHSGIATATETQLVPIHINTDWTDSDELEIEIKREAV